MCVVGTLTSLVGQFIGHDEISLGQVRFPLVRETSPSQHPAAVTSEAMISPAALRALLAEPDTQKRIRAVVSSRVRSGTPDAVRDDIVQQANLALLQSPSRPRSPKRALAWLSAVTQRQVANYFRARAAEARWLELDDDPDARPDERESREFVAPEDPWMIAPWLAQAVTANPRDQETLEFLLYKAESRKTYEEVAADHALGAKALVGRVVQFKKKYLPRHQRRRRNVALALLAGALTLAFLGSLFWYPQPEAAKPAPPRPPSVAP